MKYTKNFYELKPGDRFFFNNQPCMVVKLYSRKHVAVDLHTFEIVEIAPSEPGVCVEEEKGH